MLIGVIMALTGLALAQETPSGETQQRTWCNMSISANIEAGWRTQDVDGNKDIYRTHINLTDGFKFFNVYIEGLPTDKSSKWLDAFRISTTSFVDEPTQRASVMFRKRGVYKFDFNYRDQKYIFLYPDFARGQHRNDNQRRFYDVNLAITPGQMRVNLGFSRYTFDGSAFSTWDFSRDEFFVFAPVDRTTNDFRLGWDFSLAGIDFALEQIFRDYDGKSDFSLDPADSLGNNPTNRTKIREFRRFAPVEGTAPVSRISLHKQFGEKVDLTGRYVFSKSNVDFTAEQFVRGIDFSGNPLTQEIDWLGTADRPSHLAEIGGIVDVTEALRVSDAFRFHQYKIDGETSETITTLVGTPPADPEEEFKSDIDVHNLENQIEAEYLFNRRLAVRAGYRFGHRKVSFIDPTAQTTELDTSFTTNTFLGSVSYRFNNKLNVFLEYQNGSRDNVFTRIEPMDFQIVRFRPTWRVSEKLSVNGSLIFRDTDTPNADTTKSDVKFITGSFAFDYNPTPNAFIRLGVNRLNLDSDTDITFFSAGVLTEGVSSYVFHNTDFFVDAGITLLDRVRAEVNYNYSEATKSSSFPTKFIYLRPHVSVKLTELLWVNGGYFRYRYDERLGDTNDYKSQGFTASLTVKL
jgi:hypothetical protein